MTIQRPRSSLPCRSWRGCPYLTSLCSPALRGARSDTHTILSPSSRPWRCWIDVISPFLSRLINELSFVPRTSFDMVAASHTAVDYRMWLSLARYYYIGSNKVTDLTCYYCRINASYRDFWSSDECSIASWIRSRFIFLARTRTCRNSFNHLLSDANYWQALCSFSRNNIIMMKPLILSRS